MTARTPSQRQDALRARYKALGFRCFSVWVPAKNARQVLNLAQRLRDAAKAEIDPKTPKG